AVVSLPRNCEIPVLDIRRVIIRRYRITADALLVIQTIRRHQPIGGRVDGLRGRSCDQERRILAQPHHVIRIDSAGWRHSGEPLRRTKIWLWKSRNAGNRRMRESVTASQHQAPRSKQAWAPGETETRFE